MPLFVKAKGVHLRELSCRIRLRSTHIPGLPLAQAVRWLRQRPVAYGAAAVLVTLIIAIAYNLLAWSFADDPILVEFPSSGSQALLFGTLLTDPSKARLEYQAGIRVVHLELGWNLYEPEENRFNGQYAVQAKQTLAAYKAAGMRVVLGVGLQYAPAWIFDSGPDTRYVNQFGQQAAQLNLTFNQTAREKAERYVARVLEDLGPDNFLAARVGSGGLVETVYPRMDEGRQRNSYWAYDANAQGGGNRPPSVSPSPYPGWRPGDRSYGGTAVTQAQVEQWYEWYLRSLVDGVEWQVSLYKRLGFKGYLQLVVPGLGSRPAEYETALANYLNGAGDSNQTMGRGAVWHKMLSLLRDRERVLVHISSVADGSGGDDLCSPEDVDASSHSGEVGAWSATRWLSYNADLWGMSKSGESPGRGDVRGYGAGLLESAARQANACGLRLLMWAHDPDLYDESSGVSLRDYAAIIAAYSSR